MRYFDAERCFYFCFIEYGIVRTGCLCRIIGGMQRFYLTRSNARQAMDGYGKVIPGTNTFVTEMVNAADNAFIDRCKNSLGQIISISRCTDLIENDSQTITLFAQTDHRLHEVVAKSGIKPCGTDND